MGKKEMNKMKSLLPLLVLTLSFLGAAYLSSGSVNDQTSVNDVIKTPNTYRVVTHLHTSFSHDSKFGSEPNLQLKNLKDQGYQAVLVSEHDLSTLGMAQTDFFVPPFQNGGFETGKPYPHQWSVIDLPRESAEYMNVTDSNRSSEGKRSFHLKLQGNEDSFDILSWAYTEMGQDRVLDRSIAYNLWLRFSLYFSKLPEGSDSTVYVCSVFERRDDPRYLDVYNKLCFYFSEESWEDIGLFDLSNSTRQVSIRLDPPPLGNWETYKLNLTDYAFKVFDGLEDIPMKYLFLKKVTVNLASKGGSLLEMYADDFEVFSSWTREEMYDWWRRDIESYSEDNFLVIAGLETSLKPHIGAYGLERWHDFSVYDSVEARVKNIQATGAISALPHPRGSNFTAVKEGGGWGTELFEIFNTVHDNKPSSQVLKAWDEFLSRGSVIFGVAGFDSHGLKGTQGQREPTVVSEPVYENIVIANSLSRADILSSVDEGHVYVVRSDHPMRMSSSGFDGLQSGTVVYTSSETDVVMAIYLEGVLPRSDLILIQNGTKFMTIDVDEEPFYKEIKLPWVGKSSYIRTEVHYLGDEVAFSNPLFFRKTNLPKGVWLTLDPLVSSSKITSIESDDRQIKVQLYSPATSSALLKIHSPVQPLRVTVDGKDYTKYEMPATQDLAGNTNGGWNYRSDNQLLTVKVASEGPATVTVELPIEELRSGEPINFAVLLIAAIGAGLAVMFIKFRQRFWKRI